jgi:hypothetical protein
MLRESNPQLVENFLNVLSDHTAGDPMREDVKWTNLSRRQISRQLKKRGTPAGKNVVSQLLWEHGYRRRKPQKKRTMGQHADRNAQFENIAKIKEQYLKAGHPVISIDTKKKEILGNFHREGVTDAVEPTIVNDHDFVSASDGKVIPHGIYDVAKNEASIHLNSSCDTSELACDSIALWWQEQGCLDYPGASDMLILCDGGGSNSSSYYIFKEDLQAISNRLGIRIRICHYPPYCSKYNLIEHRVFPHVTRACQGVPLESIETAKYYIEKTETTKGLKVVVRLLEKVYKTGRKYAKDFKETMTIQFDKYLPKWNYTAIPEVK